MLLVVGGVWKMSNVGAEQTLVGFMMLICRDKKFSAKSQHVHMNGVYLCVCSIKSKALAGWLVGGAQLH